VEERRDGVEEEKMKALLIERDRLAADDK